MNSNYVRKHWYSSQDETFETGCLFVLPTTCFLMIMISGIVPAPQALLIILLLLLGTFTLLYILNRQKANTVQKVFRMQGWRLVQIVESVLEDKQLPYEKASQGRGCTSYYLIEDDIIITVKPYFYTQYKLYDQIRRIQDGIVVKIRGSEPARNLLVKALKNQIDERVKYLDLT